MTFGDCKKSSKVDGMSNLSMLIGFQYIFGEKESGLFSCKVER